MMHDVCAAVNLHYLEDNALRRATLVSNTAKNALLLQFGMMLADQKH